MKMGRTRPLLEPRRRPQAGKSGDPRPQNANICVSVACMQFVCMRACVYNHHTSSRVLKLKTNGSAYQYKAILSAVPAVMTSNHHQNIFLSFVFILTSKMAVR